MAKLKSKRKRKAIEQQKSKQISAVPVAIDPTAAMIRGPEERIEPEKPSVFDVYTTLECSCCKAIWLVPSNDNIDERRCRHCHSAVFVTEKFKRGN